MPSTTYALLVGIDAYPPPVNPLRGCVNDIRRVETTLRARLVPSAEQPQPFRPLVLTDDQATRQGIIDGFRGHLSQAGADDVAVFYFSGHGSQAPSPPAFWHLEPDHLDETLVCWDSRLPEPDRWDLADKELAQLIAEVADGGAHVVVILDCCHSGSGTRVAADAEVRSRRAETDNRTRPIESFLVNAEEAAALNPTENPTGRAARTGGGWYTLPRGRHIVLSACAPEEEAKELALGGEQRGAFSYYLLETLQGARGSLSYRDLFNRVNARVRASISMQSPQIEAVENRDLNQSFLGGALPEGPTYYTLRHDKDLGWVIDGGAVHGIPTPVDGETTILAVFPFDSPVEDLLNLEAAIGTARVTASYPAQSAVTLSLAREQAPDPQTTYKSLVTAWPLPPLVVAMEGDAAGLALVRTALAQAGPPRSPIEESDGDSDAPVSRTPSLFVREGDVDAAELILSARDNRFSIRRKGDGYALVVETPDFTPARAQLVVQRLEHIARWRKLIDLANPGSRLRAGDIGLEIELPTGDGGWQAAPAGAEIRQEYTYQDGRWQQPTFRIKLSNRSAQRLYCMAFDLTETYGIYALLPGGGIWLGPGEETWANAGEPFHGSVPDALWEAGVIEFTDTLLVIAGTDEGDATRLEQDDLPVQVVPTRRAAELPASMSILDRLLSRVQTRHLRPRPDDAEAYADWITTELSFTTVRPLDAAPIPEPGARTALGHGVSVLGHATLRARARLTTLPDTGRDIGNLTLPAPLRDHPDEVQPFEFSANRSGRPGMSVLELVDVEDASAVTPETPLRVEIDTMLGDEDVLLPLGFDGEFYWPLGHVARTARGVEIELIRLPPPTGTRTLRGSVKIMFQKLIGQRLGQVYDYPQLAVVEVTRQGNMTYRKEPDHVRAAVARLPRGERILLYVHGIIGNTAGMARSAHPASLGIAVDGLADHYGLILAFDYENLHTSIEENARLLKARLAAAGLGPDHGHTLHIVAHSMGGLVSRWFIEREGGHHVVQHLVMLGTPNGGSPWSTVQDWATAALGFGLNALAGVAWPVRTLGLLVGALEKVDVSLDQMKPGSDFLQALAASTNPGVPYTIIAGNTSLVPDALQPEPGQSPSRFARLWARIQPRNWLDIVAAPVFFGQPNDIAVAVESIKRVPPGGISVTPLDVACDHMSYFATTEGLQALDTALLTTVNPADDVTDDAASVAGV